MFFEVVLPEDALRANIVTTDARTWHERLGHVSLTTICQMAKKDALSGLRVTKVKDFSCRACRESKSCRRSFKSIPPEDKEKFEIGQFFHSDICGPMQVTSLGGARSFVTFVDDKSNYRRVFFLKHKSDVYQVFVKFEAEIYNKFGRRMSVLQSDRGAEYVSSQMREYMDHRGIKHRLSAAYTPEQNGTAERENRTLMECCRSMLHGRNLPLKLWAEVLKTAEYLLNRTSPSRNTDFTRYQLWTNRKPRIDHLRIIGSVGYAHIPKQFRKKLDKSATRVILFGYQEDSRNFRVYNPDTRKVTEFANVRFIESEIRTENLTKVDQSVWRLTAGPDDLPESDIIETEIDESRSDQVTDGDDDDDRTLVEQELEDTVLDDEHMQGDSKINDDEWEQDDGDKDWEPSNDDFQDCLRSPPAPVPETPKVGAKHLLRKPNRYSPELNLVRTDEPLTFQQAISGPDADEWKEAISRELEALNGNGTWEVTRRPERRSPIDSKWVFKVEPARLGQKKRFKARLCARGFRQLPGIDFRETFAPVVRYDTVRVMMAVAAHEDLEIVQIDVENAFLNGDLEETIYMRIPEGLDIDKRKGDCLRLLKSLYGLKQAPRCWHNKILKILTKIGFTVSSSDNSLYVGNRYECIVYFLLFVDDGLFLGKLKKIIDRIIEQLKSEIKITISELDVFV